MKAVMYHYVRPRDPSRPYFRHLSLENFKKQLDYFSENFNFVTKKQFEECLRSGEVVKNGIVLTFDDGFKDHFQYVLPELEKRSLWGVFYAAMAPFKTEKMLDVHRIHILLGKYGGEQVFQSLTEMVSDAMLSHAAIPEFRNLTYKRQNNDEYTNSVKRTLNYFIGYEYREKILDKLMEKFFPKEKPSFKDFYMNQKELCAMRNSGMTIGSHSMTHRVMSKLTVLEQLTEIRSSFELLQELVGPFDLKSFCYPYGGFHSFNSDTEKILEEQQCDFAFNVEQRDIEQKDLLFRKQALPRYDCNVFPFGSSYE